MIKWHLGPSIRVPPAPSPGVSNRNHLYRIERLVRFYTIDDENRLKVLVKIVSLIGCIQFASFAYDDKLVAFHSTGRNANYLPSDDRLTRCFTSRFQSTLPEPGSYALNNSVRSTIKTARCSHPASLSGSLSPSRSSPIRPPT